MKFAGLLLTLFAFAGVASAIPAVQVPEIDGGFLASGITLATGVLMVARGRRKK